MAIRACIVAVSLLFMHPHLADPGGSAAADACAELNDIVLVQTRRHLLSLCQSGRTHHAFVVALGHGGVGKRRRGDGKTPLGRYRLDPPRRSKQFHTFIHLGYPTKDQRRQGYTGSSIGIHGPPRGVAQFANSTRRGLTVLVDWTDGCIAVDTDDEIRTIATWLDHRHVRRIRVD